MAKIIVFAASARKASINKALAKAAHAKLAEIGADAEFVDLADYPMPIYDGDLEEGEGIPENAKKLKAKFAEADGFLIVSPEYNSSFPPLLKNVIDWCSRPEADVEGDFMLRVFLNKTAGLLSASPGGYGGLRALTPLRMLLGNIFMHVVPQQLAVAAAHEKVSLEGEITDPGTEGALMGVLTQLKDATEKLNS